MRGMRGKRAMVTFTLGGREHMFGPGAIYGEIETMLSPLLRGTLAYGFDVLPPFIGYHVPYISPEGRAQILADYRERLNAVDRLQPLKFSSMDDFDDRLMSKREAQVV